MPNFKVYRLFSEVTLATNWGHGKTKGSYSSTKEGNAQLWVALGEAWWKLCWRLRMELFEVIC